MSFLNKPTYRQRMLARRTKWDTSDARDLLEAFSLAEKDGFMEALLDDLFTDNEIEQFSKRVKVVKLLFMGMPYRQINDFTRLSSNIIARISKKTSNHEGGFWKMMRKLYPRGYTYTE